MSTARRGPTCWWYSPPTARLTETHRDGPADLVIAVLSPASEVRDSRRKRLLYADHGVPEYCIVDPLALRLLCQHRDRRRYEDRPWLAGTDQVPSRVLPGEAQMVDWWLG